MNSTILFPIWILIQSASQVLNPHAAPATLPQKAITSTLAHALAAPPPPALRVILPFEYTANMTPSKVKLGEETLVNITFTPKKENIPLRIRVQAPTPTSPMQRIGSINNNSDMLLTKPEEEAHATFGVRTFSPQDTMLPPLHVEYANEHGDWATTMLVLPALEIISVLPTGDTHNMGDADKSTDTDTSMPQLTEWNHPMTMRDPVSWTMLMSAGGVLGVLIAAWIFLRHWGRMRRAAPAPKIPPHLVALQALHDLERDALLEKGEAERFFIRLTDILRVYLEEQFTLRAPELTTEEFCYHCTQSAQLTVEQKGMLQTVLQQADLIKFAQARASADEGQQALEASRRFVNESTPSQTEGAAQ